MTMQELPGGAVFGLRLKSWRNFRKLSQLDLALSADVSQRHVSWLETGRSRPSRTMVVRLAEAMAIPLRERNRLLTAAGFAALYNEQAIEAPEMQPVQAALKRILDHHEPYPALVIDRVWNIRMTNSAMERLLSFAVDQTELWRRVGDDGSRNIARLTLHPKGLQPMISNWSEAAPAFVQRLRREAAATGSEEEQALVEELVALAGNVSFDETEPSRPLLPVLPLDIVAGAVTLRLFSVIATFGTPQDVTTDELRIESFFPADETTRQVFEQ